MFLYVGLHCAKPQNNVEMENVQKQRLIQATPNILGIIKDIFVPVEFEGGLSTPLSQENSGPPLFFWVGSFFMGDGQSSFRFHSF
jgi:hypothetical protein